MRTLTYDNSYFRYIVSFEYLEVLISNGVNIALQISKANNK